MTATTDYSINLAAGFLATFAPEGPKGQVLTLSDLDGFARRWKGHYDPDVDQPDTIRQGRNRLREWINRAAICQSWRDAGHPPYHVRVLEHSKSYVIEPAHAALNNKTSLTPGRYRSFVTTQEKRLAMILSAVDVDTLPIPLQLQLSMFQQSLKQCGKQIEFITLQTDQQFKDVMKQLQAFMPALDMHAEPKAKPQQLTLWSQDEPLYVREGVAYTGHAWILAFGYDEEDDFGNKPSDEEGFNGGEPGNGI